MPDKRNYQLHVQSRVGNNLENELTHANVILFLPENFEPENSTKKKFSSLVISSLLAEHDNCSSTKNFTGNYLGKFTLKA